MRRHSTIAERPHCHITYKLQQQQDEPAFTNGWPEQDKSSTRGRKNKKVKNRENLDACAMAASVLPATNTYNDYHLKYHSVSTGSALSQSMKYAETWLYGSLSVKPTSFRPTFLNFDRNFQGQLNLFPACFCSNHSCSNCGKQNTCNQCLIPAAPNFNSVQAFGTVRAKNGVHFYPENVVADPYDIVRQSRLGGAKKSATVRAKSHSPSQRKLIPLMALNRLSSPPPAVVSNAAAAVAAVELPKSGGDEARKSILECDINPYDLVRCSTTDADDDDDDDDVDDSPLIEDRAILVEAAVANAKSPSPKKQKITLKEKIISRLQDKGRASSRPNNKLADSPANGVCIAGQKIRIFNTPTPPSADDDGLEDWISDPSFDDEPELEVERAAGIEERQDAPKRPPRRKFVRSATKTTTTTAAAVGTSTDGPRDTTPIYQNYQVLCQSSGPPKKESRNAVTATTPVPTTTTTTTTTSHYGDIKSILKKPLNGPSSSSVGRGSNANGRLEPLSSSSSSEVSSDYHSSPTAAAAAAAASAIMVSADDRIIIDSTTAITQNLMAVGGSGNPNNNNNNQNFYPTTFSDKRCANKKVKKQVQFKGMQEQTVDDESGYSKSSVAAHDRRSAAAAADVEAYSSAKTGCNDDTAATAKVAAKTSTAAATPGTQLTQSLSGVRDKEVDVDRRTLDQRLCKSRRSNVPSTLPLSAQSVAKPCAVVASPSGFSSDSPSLLVPVSSAATECASDQHSTNAVQGRDVVAAAGEPSSRLHRTQSECTGPRPLLAQKHCDTFKDTMRLRLRCNPHQIESKRLFHPQQNASSDRTERLGRSRKICSRPAIPPPLPPNLAVADKPTTTAGGSYRAPQLPPRQYFPFEKSPVRSQTMNTGAGELVDSRGAGDNHNHNHNRDHDHHHAPVAPPAAAATAAKLRNGFAAAGSVIKINVAPDTPTMQTLQSSNHDNRTIVTITPPESESTVGKNVADEGGGGRSDDSATGNSGNNRTSITINVNDRSPLSACQSSNCNTVTINVGYNDSDIASDNSLTNSLASNSTMKTTTTTTTTAIDSNNSVYKSNVRITPQSTTNTVYVTPSPSPSHSERSDYSRQRAASRKYGVASSTPTSNQNENSNSGDTNVSNSTKNNNTLNLSHGNSNSNSNNNSCGSSVSTDSCGNGAACGSLANDFSVHYMSCRINERLTEDEVGLSQHLENEYDLVEPIYEEISETPPPLPSEPPPKRVDDIGIVIPPRSIFEGASKYDILKYLAGAKERCRIPEEPTPEFVIEEIPDSESGDPPLPVVVHSRVSSSDLSSRLSHLSNVSDSSDELASFLMCSGLNNASSLEKTYRNCTDIERNDSGVGSETSKCSRSKWQHVQTDSLQEDQQHICEDCEQPVETQTSDSGGLAYAPLVCRKCSKKRIERREIMAEIVETEEKYGRDLRIILDEFYKPMLVAGLLTADQLSSIFLNVEELLEHNTTLAEKLRDGYEIAIEQGDEDLLTFNIGKIFLDAAPMLHAFESYCTRQGNAALLLANLEKEKELLKIFLRVSQMENTVLRRMNLNSFLMVPVQRVTKYPLLLARLYKVTPEHHTVQRELLKEAQHNIELHLEHINSLTKDIGSMKIWRRISMMNGRRVSSDVDDIVNIKLQKIAVEVLEWGHEEVRFVMESRLLYAQPTDHNWKRTGRTIKVIPVNALLVTLGKPTENYNPECEDRLTFPQKNGIREASLLLMKEKGGKYSLVRDPLFLDHCIIYCDSDCEEYFEVQEIPTKDTYIFKAEDEERTRQWYKQLQYHSQGLGCWRKRRNALANIMINGMQVRS